MTCAVLKLNPGERIPLACLGVSTSAAIITMKEEQAINKKVLDGIDD